MKKKSSTRSTPACRSLSTRRRPAIAGRKLVHEGGFINLRALLGLTLCLFGLGLAILAGRNGALQRPSEPARYMPVPGARLQEEAIGLAQLEQYWHDRLTYPTGRFDPAWVRAAPRSMRAWQAACPLETIQSSTWPIRCLSPLPRLPRLVRNRSG